MSAFAPFAVFLLRTKRDKVSFYVTLGISCGAAMFAPPAKETVVNGEIIRELVLFGKVIPNWVFYGVGVPLVGFLWWGVWLLYGKLWPEPTSPTESKKFDFEKSYDRTEGGKVFWQPAEQGGRSPVDYEPPLFTKHTTAREFLMTEGPSPMRALIVGDGWHKEDADFRERVDSWLGHAPESVLHDLVSAAEEIFSRPSGRHQNEVAHTLWRAYELRGIPTVKDLSALAGRVQQAEIADILLDEDEIFHGAGETPES